MLWISTAGALAVAAAFVASARWFIAFPPDSTVGLCGGAVLVVPEGLSGSAYWVERHDAGLRYWNAWLVDGYRRFQRDGEWEPDGLAIPLYMPLVGVAAVTFMNLVAGPSANAAGPVRLLRVRPHR